jgi:hypothetical protein
VQHTCCGAVFEAAKRKEPGPIVNIGRRRGEERPQDGRRTMSDENRKISILLTMELDESISEEKANDIATQLEAIPRDDLWSAVVAEADIPANVVSVAAEVVQVTTLDGFTESEEPGEPTEGLDK